MPPVKKSMISADDSDGDDDFRMSSESPATPTEFARRKRRAPRGSNQSTPRSAAAKSTAIGYTTEPTIDELIFPEAVFKSYADFEKAFSEWKDKHLHPFRVASSEALRTQDGSVSEQFRYRYAVFHCARYGQPRVRGEGKRPNQNYLPCACTAMLRLNFSFADQCLKITSLETRHSNHYADEELYERMSSKDQAKKSGTGKTPRASKSLAQPQPQTPKTTVAMVASVKQEPGTSKMKMPSEDRTEEELSRGYEDQSLVTRPVEVENVELVPETVQNLDLEVPAPAPVVRVKQEIAPSADSSFSVPPPTIPPAAQVPVPVPVLPVAQNFNFTGEYLQPPQFTPIPSYLPPLPDFSQPSTSAQPQPQPQPQIFNNIQLLNEYHQSLRQQMMLTQMQLQATWPAVPVPSAPAPISQIPSVSAPAPTKSHPGIYMPMPGPQQISPAGSLDSITSSTVDENEAPVFTNLKPARPVALSWRENSAFLKTIVSSQPPQTASETTRSVVPDSQPARVLSTAERLLSSSVPPEVVAARLQQLDTLVASWGP